MAEQLKSRMNKTNSDEKNINYQILTTIKTNVELGIRKGEVTHKIAENITKELGIKNISDIKF